MFKLPDLPYDYNALEQAIDAQTMEIHHSKHHQAYITNLNNAIDGTADADKTLESLIATAATPAIRNNGGGHWNHSFFWQTMSGSSTKPNAALSEAIKNTFGSLEDLKQKINQAGATRFGSGWAWLVLDKNNKLVVTSTPNQDNPLMDVAEVQGVPLIGIDVWEHAYYLRYQNRRPDYLNAWWQVVNWDEVSRIYQEAK